MSDAFGCEENPYASPNDPCPPGIDAYGRLEPIRVVADWFDVVLYLTRAATLIAVFLGVFTVIGLLCHWLGQFSGVFFLVGVILGMPCVFWLSRAEERKVKALSIDADGLHFHRERLPPDDWPWQTVSAIRLASRWEVAWYGWFRSLLRPRDPTECNSALGHYRIQGKTDYCFYPPKNPEAFVEAVARYRPDLLQPPEQNPQ
ncbi:MAG: hypothetical protein GXX96_18365 [Planctomycetaceae bacterium]|nr:hypothetical protein [Planctomycetaceae bacterium]